MAIPIRTRIALSALPASISGVRLEYFYDDTDSNPFFWITDTNGAYSGFGINLAALIGSTGKIAAELENLELATAELADGALSADAAGRLKIANGFFDAATVLNKFAAGALVGSLISDKAVNYTDDATEVEVEHSGAASVVLLGADANVDRVVLVQAIATETCVGAGPRTKFDVGTTGLLTSCFNDLATGAWVAGERYFGICVVPKTTELLCSVVNGGGGVPAGKVKFRMLVVTPLVQETQIANGAVTDAKLAGSITAAKLAGSIPGSLLLDTGVNYLEEGAEVEVDHAGGSPIALLAADPNLDRLVLVQAIASETAVDGPDFDVGWAGGLNSVFDDIAAGAWVTGQRYLGLGVLPSTQALVCTVIDGGGTAAGKIKFRTLVVTPVVQANQIATGAVTNAKLGGSITGDKLLDSAVGYANTAVAVTVDHADGSPKTILAADALLDRVVMVQAIATEAAAGGPDIDIGSDGDTNAVFDDLASGVWGVGERYFGICTLPATEKLVATIADPGTAGAFTVRYVVITPTIKLGQIAAGFLAASADGRAKIAASFFDAATALDKFAAGAIADSLLASKLVKDPGALANSVLRMSGVYVDGDTFTIGTDVFEIDPIATDSTDDTAGGFWNVVTSPLTVAMPAASYAVLGVGGTDALTVGELVYINTEYLRVTAIVGNDVTFRRGAGGSAIAAHVNATNIMVSAVRTAVLPVGVQADFAVATVTPILAATINEPAGAVGQSADVVAASVEAGATMLVIAEAVGAVVLATTQVSTNGLWDNAIMRRGAAAGVKQIYRTAIVPDAEEVTAELLYVPLPFTPTTVLVHILVTADGKELETAAAAAVQKWDGAMTIVAPAAPVPAYVLLTAGTTVKWTAAHTLHILAIE